MATLNNPKDIKMRNEVDNFEQIKSMLVFDSEDDFYHLQILKRKKEHLDLGSNSLVIKTYYISSAEYLEMKRGEIVHLCDFHSARAYINLNRRSFEKMAFNTLKKITDQIMNRDFRSVRKAYESTCGAHSNEPHRKWILDIDWADYGSNKDKQLDVLVAIRQKVELLLQEAGKDLTVHVVETKNGVHLITPSFNPMTFKKQFPEVDIQKNNPTILYVG